MYPPLTLEENETSRLIYQKFNSKSRLLQNLHTLNLSKIV